MGITSKRAPVQVEEVLEGRYRIQKLLAEGGMGSVWLAEHMLIKRRVAIKVLHAHLATDAHVVDCFLNEARAAGMLGHPNIVESTDMGFTREHVPYIVFEYLEGSLLTDEIYRVAGMPMHRAVRIAEQIAGALHVAHEAGIVHRDLKSDNIFLTDKDEASDHVKVIDFGISRFMNDNTQRAMVAGTPEFMAPEQMTDPEGVDRRADIYALGVILYEMLTARRPFLPGNNPQDLQRAIITEQHPPMNRTGIPTGLIDLVDRMLAKDPNDRPQTMQAVAAALDAFMTHGDGSAMNRRRSMPLPTVRPEDMGRDSSVIPNPRGMLNTPYPNPMIAAPRARKPYAMYTVAGLSVVVGALGVAWGLKGPSKATEVQPVAKAQPAPAPLPAAAIPRPTPKAPEVEKIAVSVDADAPNSHVTFRRRVAQAPMATEIAATDIVELVEVSAPGYKTERYWLTLDRATHLRARLTKGAGLVEASEEATLAALGEVSPAQPAIAAAAPAPVATKAVVEKKAVVAEKPVVVAAATPAPRAEVKVVEKTVAKELAKPRKIGRGEAPATGDEPRPAFVDAAPVVAQTLPEPTRAEPAAREQTMPEAAKAEPAVSQAQPAVAKTEAPHNISPAAFKALRLSGNVQIDAPTMVAKEMVRDSKAKVSAAVKVCVNASGEITVASMIKSSGYEGYDKVLLDGVRGWKFKTGEAVCSAVTFAFTPGK